MSKQKCNNPKFIDDVQFTNDCLTSRAGLNLFVRYLRGIYIFPHIERLFGSIRKHPKGAPIDELFKQVLCFLFDGTSRHLIHFDSLTKDAGYAAAIETAQEGMVSSHAIKRLFRAFSPHRTYLFRRLLLHLFIWRLNQARPNLIQLNLDTMVMDNDQAHKRQGVKPTYKKVQGFQPLQMTWGRFIIDAVFRGGDKHSNHGDTAAQMIRHVVRMIRTRYSQAVPIIIRMDSGFFDQDLFAEMENLDLGFICGGRFYGDIKAMLTALPEDAFDHHFGKVDEDVWQCFEFGDRRKSWDRFYRAIFWRPLLEEKQYLLPGSRPGTLVYTNLGMDGAIDQQLRENDFGYMAETNVVIHSYHQRGADELVHRAFKDFGFEELPFKRFLPNSAFYYTMLLGFFLFEAFKEDVSQPVVPVTAFPATLRRKLVDVAAKIVKHAGRTVLKVTAVTMKSLRFKELWERCLKAQPFSWA
ncbi:MAG: IS1380 family transposase [Proteobacteria bacterium]|nr:IS1380 family transposase [Pseudomonadota bacterium]MBU1612039.1 IS1380 family transposase [Pseudomonadota bacterium]